MIYLTTPDVQDVLMRLFYGIDIDDQVAGEIDHWRSQSLPPYVKPVPRENFHITLGFVGEKDEAACETLIMATDGIRVAPFEITLDTMGYWPKQQISYLAPAAWPAEIDNLAQTLRRLMSRHNIKADKRTYQPHLTLARRCELEPPVALIRPAFRIYVDGFHLYESRRMKTGVRYEVIASWNFY